MSRYRVYLCSDDDDRRVVPNETCPLADHHTPEPPGYLTWHRWAEEMDRTHVQRSCPSCGLKVVWTPKGEGSA